MTYAMTPGRTWGQIRILELDLKRTTTMMVRRQAMGRRTAKEEHSIALLQEKIARMREELKGTEYEGR